MWHLELRVSGAEAAIEVAAALDESAGAVAAFESDAAAAEWRIDAYPKRKLLTPDWEVRLALAARAAGGTLLAIAEQRLPARDWAAENRRAFPPLYIGGFFIHGSHWCGRPPAGLIGIEIDAASAFGTGEHASTSGCLLALERLAKGGRRRWRTILDMGTGSGILAIAAAKRLRVPVTASDIDAEAVRVARRHARRNGVAGAVRIRRAAGYRGRFLKGRNFALVFANILARPLALMAPDLRRALAPGGYAILAGLLERQQGFVLAAHRAQHLVLERRTIVEGWSTLVLRRPQKGGNQR